MPDLSLCTNNKCPFACKTTCYRYMAVPSQWQSYCSFKYKNVGGCPDFEPILNRKVLQICPNCKEGKLIGIGCPGHKVVVIKCDICNGTGVLPDNMKYQPDRGKKIKDSRIKKKITLRQAVLTLNKTLRINIMVNELSKIERGYFTDDMLAKISKIRKEWLGGDSVNEK